MLAPKNVSINVTQLARDWLAKKGYDPKMGARPFERLFETSVKKPLSKHILFGRLKNVPGRVNVDVTNDEISVVVLDPVLELITN